MTFQASRPEAEINQLLLQAHVLLDALAPASRTADTDLRALDHASAALSLARSRRRRDLEARAHLFRGHALRALGCRGYRAWRLAHAAYVRAARALVLGAAVGGAEAAQLESLCAECKARAAQERAECRRERWERARLEGRGGRGCGETGDNDEIDWEAAGQAGEEAGVEEERESILLRDADGKLIDIIERPSLRSLKGKSVARLV